MDIVEPRIEQYLRQRYTPTSKVQADMEALAHERDFPIVGPLVGAALELLAKSIQARRVLEMGSGFGYSAYFFGRAVGPTGKVVCTETDANNVALAANFLSSAGLSDRVELYTGDARARLKDDAASYDIIFCDADKEQYPECARLAMPRVRVGGYLVFDNALWSGQILGPNPDDATQGVLGMHDILFENTDWHTVILPIRDGVLVSLKLR